MQRASRQRLAQAAAASRHVLTTIGDTTGRVRAGEGDVTHGLDLRPAGRPRASATFSQFDVMDDARADPGRVSRPAHQRAGRQPVRERRARASAELEFNLARPDLEQARRSTPTSSIDGHARRRRASSTSTRRSSSQARAAGRDRPREGVATWASTSQDIAGDAAARWSAASRSEVQGGATSSTTSGCAPSRPTADDPHDIDDLTVASPRGAAGAARQPGAARARSAARRRSTASNRAAQGHASSPTSTACRSATPSTQVRERSSRSSNLPPHVQHPVRRAGQDARRDRPELRHRLRCSASSSCT